METKSAQCCRGCLTELNPNEVHSFQWTEIRQLFEDCTNLKVSSHPEELHLPQSICSPCYTQCEQWYTFRTMCREIDKFMHSSSFPKVANRPDPPHDQPTPNVQIKEEAESESEGEIFDGESDTADLVNFGQLEVDNLMPVVAVARLQIKDENTSLDTPSSNQTKNGNQKGDPDWDCPVCLSKLPESVPLKEHLKEHLSESDPQCPICNESFSRSSKIYPHILSLHMGKKSEGSSSRNDPDNRSIQSERNSSSHGTEKCPLCPATVKSLYRHLTDEHVKNGDKVCPICSRHFHNSPRLKIHLVAHTNEKPYVCQLCERKFTQPGGLRKHMRDTHPNETPEIIRRVWIEHADDDSDESRTCPICSLTVASLYRHLTDEHVKRGDKECPICSKILQDITALKLHLVVHTNEKPFACRLCESRFTHPASVRNHMRDIHPNEETPKIIRRAWGSPEDENSVRTTDSHGCDEDTDGEAEDEEFHTCPICYLKVDSLYRHLTEEHVSAGDKTCPICSLTCHDSSAVKLHLVVHTNEKPYACRLCESRFSRPSCLRKHMRNIHPNATATKVIRRAWTEDEREEMNTPLANLKQCPLCPHKSGSLYFHLVEKHVHRGEKQCPICGDMFTDRTNVEIHIVRHTDEKPFKCRICNKRIVSVYNINPHMRARHPDEPLEEVSVMWDRAKREHEKREGYAEKDAKQMSRVKVERGDSNCQDQTDQGRIGNTTTTGGNGQRKRRTKKKSLKARVRNLASRRELNEGVHSHRCPKCKKGFSYRGKLNRHMITHTNFKPYSCSMCKMKFNQLSNTKRHERICSGHRRKSGIVRRSDDNE